MFDVKLYDKLTTYCAYRERCTREVQEKMRELKIEKDDWSGYTEKLQDQNFLNDERFVKSFVSAYSKKKWGKVKIRSALMRKGLDTALVKKYLDDVDAENYEEQIRELAERKLRTIKGKTPRDRQTKMMRFLLGKGFEMDKVLSLIKSLKF